VFFSGAVTKWMAEIELALFAHSSDGRLKRMEDAKGGQVSSDRWRERRDYMTALHCRLSTVTRSTLAFHGLYFRSFVISAFSFTYSKLKQTIYLAGSKRYQATNVSQKILAPNYLKHTSPFQER
jgi:hypothetical protein